MSNTEIDRVLLIDDDKVFGKIMNTQAKKLGLKLDSVETIRDLKKPDSICDYDILLVDYDLDDMTGIEVAEYLQEKYPGKPVYLVSATNRPKVESMTNLPNVKGFASKWSQPRDILQYVLGRH